MSGCRPTAAASMVVALAVAAPAQEPGAEHAVPVVVTAVADRSVYLDHGRDAGLAVGTRVRLFPPGVGEVEVEVRVVTQTSARADLPPGVPAPPVGTRGEALAVLRRPTPAPRPRPDAPPHPGWTRDEPARAPDQPLLVPAFRQHPDRRPASSDGRLFGSLQYSTDRGGDRDAEYLLGRLGLRADAGNVLGHAERWRVAGELLTRQATVDGVDTTDDSNGRLDLLSVAFGGEAWAPTGVELGRFLSPHLPEIGLVDGVEVVRRYAGGVRLGAGFGAYPRPFPARDSGDDLGVHVFADWIADERRTAALAVGVQKTWHRGSSDRDLLLLRGEWRPGDRSSLYGSAKLDVYDGSDGVKGRGVELTEAMVQARWDGDGGGLGVGAQRFTWPELKREEYVALPVELVRDGHVDRLSAHGWWRPGESLTLRGRAEVWRDQQRDGTTFGLDADWRAPWSRQAAVAFGAFVNDGGFAAGPGARVGVRDRVGDLAWRVDYRWYRYELTGSSTGPERFVRQSFALSLSWPLGAGGDLDLSAERWFGDREDATALGLYVQWRF